MHSQRIGPASLLGANPNPISSPRGPSQGAWHHTAGDWGPPNPSAGLSLPPCRHPGREGRCLSFRAGERAQPSQPTADFEGTPRQTPGPTLPLTSALTLALPSARCLGSGSGLLASLGLTLTLRRPPRDPSQGTWCHNAGDWGPRAPAPVSPCPTVNTRAARGAASHSELENGQGPPNHR